MSQVDKDRWDERYRAGEYEGRPYPAPFLQSWLATRNQRPSAPARALDVACGLGRNARLLARSGYDVDAVDVSQVAIDKATELAREEALAVNWQAMDLDEVPLPNGPYQLIVVCRFLDRRLVPDLKRRLAVGGRLVYEQHVVMTTDEQVGGPKSARFRLQPNELLHLFSDLHVVHYNEGLVSDPDGALMALAQLVAEHRVSDGFSSGG